MSSQIKTHYILIDYENVPVKSLALLKGEYFRLRVFLGLKNTKLATELVLAMNELGDHADYIVLEAGGHNALDFHITYYLGRFAEEDPAGQYYIISKDTGFDSLIKHLNKNGIHCQRAVSIEALPCIAKPKPSPAPKPASAVKPKANPATKKKAQELVDQVLANFARRKTGMPRTEKTLRSTIKMLCGAQYSDKEIDAVFNRLVKKGIVTIDGARASYCLPNGDSH
jgi:hypothetical protein